MGSFSPCLLLSSSLGVCGRQCCLSSSWGWVQEEGRVPLVLIQHLIHHPKDPALQSELSVVLSYGSCSWPGEALVSVVCTLEKAVDPVNAASAFPGIMTYLSVGLYVQVDSPCNPCTCGPSDCTTCMVRCTVPLCGWWSRR